MERLFIPLATHNTPETQGGFELSTISDITIEKLNDFDFVPVLASGAMKEDIQDELYEESDGLLLLGGRDFGLDHKRDRLSMNMLKKARSDGKPTLGICLGGQMMALAAGGTLIEHIPNVTDEKHGTSIDTYDAVHPSSIYHDVYIKPNTKAHTIFQRNTLYVPSRHHQGIDNPGDLIVSGRSPGGIAEIVEHPTLPFHMGVQTHPELLTDMDELFVSYKDAVKQYKKTKKRRSH